MIVDKITINNMGYKMSIRYRVCLGILLAHTVSFFIAKLYLSPWLYLLFDVDDYNRGETYVKRGEEFTYILNLFYGLLVCEIVASVIAVYLFFKYIHSHFISSSLFIGLGIIIAQNMLFHYMVISPIVLLCTSFFAGLFFLIAGVVMKNKR